MKPYFSFSLLAHRLGLLLAATSLTLIGCSSARLKVMSEPPNAEVFISGQRSVDRQAIGRTPLEIPYREIQQKLALSDGFNDFFSVTVEAKDFEPSKLLLPSLGFGAQLVTAQVVLQPRQEVKNANVILQRLHNAQKLANGQQYERAHLEVDKALELDPKFVRSISMKASLFYLQKNFDESLKWYERALVEDDAFDEALRMIAKIKQERK